MSQIVSVGIEVVVETVGSKARDQGKHDTEEYDRDTNCAYNAIKPFTLVLFLCLARPASADHAALVGQFLDINAR